MTMALFDFLQNLEKLVKPSKLCYTEISDPGADLYDLFSYDMIKTNTSIVCVLIQNGVNKGGKNKRYPCPD